MNQCEKPVVFNHKEARSRDEAWLKELEASLPENKPVCFNYAANRRLVLDLAHEVVDLHELAGKNQALMRSMRDMTVIAYDPNAPVN